MEIVSFEIAKKLKEKGFPQHITDEAYIVDNYGEDECDIGDRLPIPLIPDYTDDVAAPTISQVLKWLREEKEIDIVIYPIDGNTVFMGGEKYILSVYINKKRDYKLHHDNIDKYVKWELAALAGIEYVIDNLI